MNPLIPGSATTVRIAWRSLWRNPRRTSLALAAIGLSVTLVLTYTSVLRAYGDWIVDTMTGPMLGHVQAHAPGWRKDRLIDQTLRDVDRMLIQVRTDPNVAGATARLYAPALAARGEEGFAVIVIGLDTAAESGPARLLPPPGRTLRQREAMVGRQLGESMGLRVGDQLAIVGQGVDGSLANELFTAVTLVTTSVDLVNRQGVMIDLTEAQTLFAMPGEAHELVIHSARPAAARELAARVAAMPSLAGAEVLDWERLAPEMISLIQIVDIAGLLVLVLVFVAAIAGVANTMLMATFERTREFGMLLALGVRPLRIVVLVLLESLALGAIGALVGAAAGVILVAVTHRTGIDYATLTGGGPGELSFAGLRWSLRFYPTLTALDVVRTAAAVGVTSLIAAAWPALRASRQEPARALRGL
jgi:putative ABC transport system permease protein